MSERFGGIAACVFDAYGTLFDIGAIADTSRDALGDRAVPLVELWRRKQLEYSWLRSLMGRHTDFWHVTGESLDFAMAALGIDDPALRARLMEAFLLPSAYADAEPALRQLRQGGLKTAILSNGSTTMLTAALDETGLHAALDAVLSVEAAGIFKPHSSVYKLATDRFGLEPAAVLFVSANGWDAHGAAAFGFKVAWINRLGAQAERLPGHPDAEIRSLAELPGLLGL